MMTLKMSLLTYHFQMIVNIYRPHSSALSKNLASVPQPNNWNKLLWIFYKLGKSCAHFQNNILSDIEEKESMSSKGLLTNNFCHS